MSLLKKITLYPKQDVDYLSVVRGKPSLDQMVQSMKITPSWKSTPNLSLLFEFNGDFVSSSVVGLTSRLVGFSIYRRSVNDSVLHHVSDLHFDDEKSIDCLYDYTVQNNTEYIYTIIPLTENEAGVALEGSAVTTDFDTWSIIAIKPMSDNTYVSGDIWTLESDVTTNPFTQNTCVTKFDGFSKYPKVSIGERNYVSGSVSAKLGQISCETMQFDDNVQKLEAWRHFITQNSQFLIKDIKGQMFISKILADTTYEYDDSILQMPTTVSFEFVETVDASDKTVYSVELRE